MGLVVLVLRLEDGKGLLARDARVVRALGRLDGVGGLLGGTGEDAGAFASGVGCCGIDSAFGEVGCVGGCGGGD